MSGSDGGSGFVSVTVSPDPGFKIKFEELRGTEKLGRPFEYELNVSSETPKGELTALLGSSATVAMTKPDKSKRYFNGIITRARFAGMSSGAYRYRLELRPWIWLLSRSQDCRIFQNKTVWDVITTVFRDASFSDFSDKRQNQAGSQMLEYCVQYNETSLDFVTRLMEVYGIYYYFTHANGKHTLVLADDSELTHIGRQGDPLRLQADRVPHHRSAYLGLDVGSDIAAGRGDVPRLQLHHAVRRPDRQVAPAGRTPVWRHGSL